MSVIPGSVAVCYLSPGEVETLFHNSVVNLLLHDAQSSKRILGPGGRVISMISGPRIASGRNVLCAQVLRSQAEWMLMLDSDMVFAPDALDRLLAGADSVKRPILGGLCFAGGYESEIRPTMYRFSQGPDGSLQINRLVDWEPNKIVQVSGTGAAFLVVHRSVLEAMDDQFTEQTHKFFAEGVHGDAEFGEDVFFCVRAQRLGFTVWVDTGCQIGHVKPHLLDLKAYQAQQAEIAGLTPEEMQARQLERLHMQPMEAPETPLPRQQRRQLERSR